MVSRIAVFVFIIIALAGTFDHARASSNVVCSWNNFIDEPLMGKPAIWLQGSEDAVITIDGSRVSDAAIDNATTWVVVLEKATGPAGFAVAVPVEQVDTTPEGYQLHLAIAEEVPVDLYDLTVSIQTGTYEASAQRRNAVKVIDSIKERFSIIHITDIHVGDPRGCLVNCAETAGRAFIRKMIHMVNLLDPEFAVITGDHVFGADYYREYAHLHEVLQEFDVPIFMSIGNHDAVNHAWSAPEVFLDGAAVFADMFAPLAFTMSYGPLSYFSLNSSDWSAVERTGVSFAMLAFGGQLGSAQLDRFEQQLNTTGADLILAGLHHPPQHNYAGEGVERFRSLASEHGVAAVLSGHTHGEEALEKDGVLYLTTASSMFSGHGGSYPAVRVLEIDDSEIVSWNYEEPQWSVPVYRGSGPHMPLRNLSEPALYCTFSPENDGSNATVTATLTNHLSTGYDDVSLEFAVPSPGTGGSYGISGGEVAGMYDTGTVQIWYVKTGIEAGEQKNIVIAPTGP